MTKTMTAEEVDNHEAFIREALGYDSDALSELAAQAARVPGLLADVAELDKLAAGQRRRAERAESEHDAARLASNESTALRERVATLEGERDVLQARVGELENHREVIRKKAQTAEARVRELEATVSVFHGLVTDLQRLAVEHHERKVHVAPMTILDVLASQPPPDTSK